jgi:hypothetical protein
MSEPEAREIDLLEALGEGLDELLAAIEATEESSTYLDGQAAFFEATLEAIPDADEDERPQTVLERVASQEGIELAEGGLPETPLAEREAGALGAWGIAIGYLEGFHAGANRVIAQVEQTPPGVGDERDEH